jgi:hypothetical protein
LFEFWIPFGGGICVLWCLGSAFSGRITAQFSDGSRAVLIAVLVTQIMLSLWWTRDFWLYGAFTTSVRPSLWVPNFLWAAVVMLGMPVSIIIGARSARTTRTA